MSPKESEKQQHGKNRVVRDIQKQYAWQQVGGKGNKNVTEKSSVTEKWGMDRRTQEISIGNTFDALNDPKTKDQVPPRGEQASTSHPGENW